MFDKTEGIVLRAIEYKDSDKLLTLFTREQGKLTVKAQGVKSNRSRNRAACQLFAYSEFTLAERQGRFTLRESVTKELFPELQGRLEWFALGNYFLQVVDFAAQENDPMPELLSLLLNCLYSLCRLNKPEAMVKTVFELRTACILGFLPELHGCSLCGNNAPDRFNITQGGLQCSTCRQEGENSLRIPISAGTLAAMRYICLAEGKRLLSFQTSQQTLEELSQVTEAYLSVHLERGFSTLDYYKSLHLRDLP